MDLLNGMPSDQFPRMNEVTGTGSIDFVWVWKNQNPELHWGAAFYRGGVFLFPHYQYQYWMAHGGEPIGVEIIHRPEEW